MPILPGCFRVLAELTCKLPLGVECDDMFERHPLGLESALLAMSRRSGLPIYLTEHGSSSSDEAFRERDLRENLAAMHRAMGRGADLRGFYYWSLLDNFEWQFGYSKKFGLLSVGFDDDLRPRKMKPLAQTFRKICVENSVPAHAGCSISPVADPVNPLPNAPAPASAPLCGSPVR